MGNSCGRGGVAQEDLAAIEGWEQHVCGARDSAFSRGSVAWAPATARGFYRGTA